MSYRSSKKQVGDDAAKMAEERVGVGLDDQNVEGLQQVGRLGPLVDSGSGRGRRQHLDGQAADDLFGAQNGQGHAHQVEAGANRDALAQHVGRLDARRRFAEEPPREAAGRPGPKDGGQ